MWLSPAGLFCDGSSTAHGPCSCGPAACGSDAACPSTFWIRLTMEVRSSLVFFCGGSMKAQKWPFHWWLTQHAYALPATCSHIHLNRSKQQVISHLKEGGWCVYTLVSDFFKHLVFYPVIKISSLTKICCVQKLSMLCIYTYPYSFKIWFTMYVQFYILFKTYRVSKFCIVNGIPKLDFSNMSVLNYTFKWKSVNQKVEMVFGNI